MSNVEPVGRDSVEPKTRGSAERRPTKALLHDLERGPLPVPRSRAGQQRADCLNSLAIAANDSAYVGLPQLDPEDRRLSRRNLRQHHLIGKLNQLADDELEELLHEPECIRTLLFVTPVDRARSSYLP